jgi:hypothetical protein
MVTMEKSEKVGYLLSDRMTKMEMKREREKKKGRKRD